MIFFSADPAFRDCAPNATWWNLARNRPFTDYSQCVPHSDLEVCIQYIAYFMYFEYLQFLFIELPHYYQDIHLWILNFKLFLTPGNSDILQI